MKNFLANLLDLARAAADELLTHLYGAALVTVDDPARSCVVPGRRPHPATDGLLCRHHLEELGTWLRDIEREAGDLDPAPSMSIRLGQGGGGGSLASQQTPVDLDAVVYTDRRTTAVGGRHPGPVCDRCPRLFDAGCPCPTAGYRVHLPGCRMLTAHRSCINILADRDEWEARADRLLSVYAVLHGWAQQVRDEREFGIETVRVIARVPGHRGPICDDCRHPSCIDMRWVRHLPLARTITSERDLLTRQLERWIVHRPWVVDMRVELADLRGRLMRHNRNQDDEPLSGWCYRLVDGVECGGDLWPVEPTHSTGQDDVDVDVEGPPRPRAVVCGRDPEHRWQGAELALLSVILRRQSEREAPEPVTRHPAERTPTFGAGGRLAAVLEDQQRREGR